MGKCNLFTPAAIWAGGTELISYLYRMDYLLKNKNLQNKGKC